MPNPNDKRDDTLLGQAAKAGVATGLAKSIGGDGAAKLVSGAMVAGDLLHGNIVCIPCTCTFVAANRFREMPRLLLLQLLLQTRLSRTSQNIRVSSLAMSDNIHFRTRLSIPQKLFKNMTKPSEHI
jgi:hypothetical protein